MTPEQVNLVKESWQKAEPISTLVAQIFYTRLFELRPELKGYFKGDMDHQGRKLMAVISVAVRSLDRLDALLPTVRNLGRRHAGYGVMDQHYETVGEALLWTLELSLAEAFTAPVKDAWVETYTTLATVMKAAASESEAVLETA